MSTPRDRRQERISSAILQEARKIIREDGPEGLSMRRLADAIDYTPGALYSYFDGKDAIIATICEDGFVALAHEMAAALQDEMDAVQKLVAVGLAYLHFARTHPEVYTLMFGRNPEPGTLQDTQEDTAFNILVSIIAEGVQNGVLARRDVMEMAYQSWVGVHGIAHLEHTLLAADPDFPAMGKRIVAAHAESLRR